jgi:Undecaprenyl-phosphate galactose phosphotransferase WbaP
VALSLILCDVVVGAGAFGAMFGGVALVVDAAWTPIGFADMFVKGVIPSLALWMMIRSLLNLYAGYGSDPPAELRLQTHASVLVLVVVSVAAFGIGMGERFFYLLLPVGGFGLLFVAPAARAMTKRLLVHTGLWGKPVVVLGSGERACECTRAMLEDYSRSFRPVAIFDNSGEEHPGSERLMPDSVTYGGDIGGAPEFARAAGINTAILIAEKDDKRDLEQLTVWARSRFEHVVMVTGLMGLNSSAMVAHNLAGVMGIEMNHNLLDSHELRIKRVIDMGLTVAGGIFVLPIFLVLALLVWLETRGSVFYTDQRLGRDGKLFSCIKFRTMVFDAEDALQQMLEQNHEAREEYSKFHKLRYDPRVTRIGRFLRKTSLDELPQLWNVLRGEMSLVGPRPYLPRESGEIGEHLQEISRVYPGITGPWQVSGRSRTTFGERVEMDVHYIRNWSVWFDLLILARTAGAVLSTRGAE